jgi:hypothetical protein
MQGKGNFLTFSWMVDSTIFNHMISSTNALHNIYIQITNDNSFYIIEIGDLGYFFNYIFYASISIY